MTWEAVPAIYLNGVFFRYDVRFDPLQFPLILLADCIITMNMSVVLTGLQEYVDYNIIVRAYTSVGPGPYSEYVKERTLEDRELIITLNAINSCILNIGGGTSARLRGGACRLELSLRVKCTGLFT